MFLAAVIAGFMGGSGTGIGYPPVNVPLPSCGVGVGQVQTADPYGIAPVYCGNVRLEPDTVTP